MPFYSEIPLKQSARKISKYHNSTFIMLRVTIEPAVLFIIRVFIERNWEMQNRAIESEKPIWPGDRIAKENNFLILVCLYSHHYHLASKNLWSRFSPFNFQKRREFQNCSLLYLQMLHRSRKTSLWEWLHTAEIIFFVAIL